MSEWWDEEEKLIKRLWPVDPNRRGQDRDNYIWIEDAEKNKLVVGTKARILYQMLRAEGMLLLNLTKWSETE